MKIAVDFDGTIVEHRYPQIGKEIPFAIDTLKMLQQGDRSRKLNAEMFIDDRNLGGLPDWGVIYQMIKGNKTFAEIHKQEPVKKKRKWF